MSEAEDTANKVCDAMVAEHARRAEYFQSAEDQKCRLKDTVWVERNHKDVLSRHRQQSWHIPGVILRTTGQEVHVIQVGNNKIVQQDHNQLLLREPDPHGRAVPRTPSTATTTGRGTSTPPSTSSRTSRIPAHQGDSFTRSDGKVLQHRGTRGILHSALCRDTRPCGWTTSKPRKSSWMSRMCWFTWSWATQIEAIAPYAYFCASIYLLLILLPQ